MGELTMSTYMPQSMSFVVVKARLILPCVRVKLHVSLWLTRHISADFDTLPLYAVTFGFSISK